MQITAKHAERQRVRAGQDVKKGFFSVGSHAKSRDVIHGHAQMPVFIETNFADTALTILDQATVAARETAQRAVRKMLGQSGAPSAVSVQTSASEAAVALMAYRLMQKSFEVLYSFWMRDN